MFDRFIEYLCEMREDDLSRMTIEDMAIGWAWCRSYEGDAERSVLVNRARAVIEQWLTRMKPVDTTSEGCRQQPVLRGLMNDLETWGTEGIERDEVDVLIAAYDLMTRVATGAYVERPLAKLAPYMDGLRALYGVTRPEPGLPHLADRVCIVRSDDIARARPREVRRLAGIDVSYRGPVFPHRGTLKVLDRVPENAIVVVEDGGCFVNGFVFGTVLASKHCEVMENISGTVIVTQGDIRLRNIVDRATVISKSRRIRCRNVLGPKLAFAGTLLWVKESMVRGTCIAPQIEVGGSVTGGLVEVSKSVVAACFRASGTHDLSVVLRRELSCEDFGEAISQEGRRLLAQRIRLTDRAASIESMVDLTRQESEEYAAGTLMFLIGGDKTSKLVEEAKRLQSRLAFVDRVIASIDMLKERAERTFVEINRAVRMTPEEIRGAYAAAAASVKETSSELDAMRAEGEVDADLVEGHEEVLSMCRQLEEKRPEEDSTSVVVSGFDAKRTEWCSKRKAIVESLRAKHEELFEVVGRTEVLDQAQNISRVKLLRRVLAAAREFPSDAQMAERVNSGLMRVMLRTLKTKLDQGSRAREMLRQTRSELEEVCTMLRRDHQCLLADSLDAAQGSVVRGCFDRGVRIAVDRCLLDRSEVPSGMVVVTPDTEGRAVTYVRRGQRILLEHS
ncbi:MAG TPA: hypothetical protein PLO37_07525 [Candidatus Hydrogenedentes bacterium]|nr:hypothetical protein [Candidatus Hydrogenedentota bacterium]HPG66681.1 hypothetical protein [Candidatus Hydrogenedentota bacterium]